MKRFSEIVIQVKTIACIIFTAIALVFTLAGLLLGIQAVSIWRVPQIALLSFFFALLYFICFSNLLFKKLSYFKRVFMMAGPLFLIQTLCIWLFGWFNFSNLRALGVYCGIFVLCLVGCMVGFYVYYRFTGRRYDGLLEEYRTARRANE